MVLGLVSVQQRPPGVGKKDGEEQSVYGSANNNERGTSSTNDM